MYNAFTLPNYKSLLMIFLRTDVAVFALSGDILDFVSTRRVQSALELNVRGAI
jgi:hypothetical protein